MVGRNAEQIDLVRRVKTHDGLAIQGVGDKSWSTAGLGWDAGHGIRPVCQDSVGRCRHVQIGGRPMSHQVGGQQRARFEPLDAPPSAAPLSAELDDSLRSRVVKHETHLPDTA